MKRTALTTMTFATGLGACAMIGGVAHAQSVDSLLDKLVDKGVLTTQEAADLKTEADKDFTRSYAAKSGMADWVTSLKLNGEFRGRYEAFWGENDLFTDRDRFRYRLRLGVTAVLKDNFEVGMRLSSVDFDSGLTAGADPISNNQTFQNNGSKKGIGIDLAYGKWSFLNTKEMSSAIAIGKIENPFVFSPMVMDHDYTPEGAGLTYAYRFNDQHSIKLIGGTFVLDELGASSRDPWMYGGQARWDAAWSKMFASSAGIGILNIEHSQSLTNSQMPNINRGNTRNGDGTPSYHFNPWVGDASFTVTFDQGPLYKAPFPVKIGGAYMENPAAPSDAGNKAFEAGIVVGKASKKGTWELSYRWEYLGANAWWEELTDSDFGAYYSTEPPNSGLTTTTPQRYGAGTNVRGHVIRGAWSPYDSVTLAITYYLTSLISQPPGFVGSSDMGRLQADVIWKF